jgi:protein phosphatase
VIRDGRVVISHVGDCRVYHQRGNALTQVTHDHSLVARMVEMGKLTPEEAVGHPASNQVTQAIGKQGPIQPSQHELELERGDWLIVACDGLTAHVAEEVLRATAQHAVPSAAFLAKRLVELANEGGGTDNCTVVAACCY